MKLHIWTDRFSYLAVAHADSVSEARELLLKESDLGESGDGSCPERDKARRAILSETSAVYVGRVAEFSLSDNAQLREQENHSEKLHQQIAAKDRRIAELEAALGSEKETRVKYQDIVYAVCVRLEQMGAPRPLLITEVTTALAALLAQARREALEAAADVFAVDPYRPVERSLRRMAREVK